MIARLQVYSPDGGTLRGTLPTEDLRFSLEVGGAGDCVFTASAAELDALSARDSVIRVEVETAPATWTAVAAYALRPPFRREKVGFDRVQCTARSLLEAWATETIVMPEYADAAMPRGSGVERSLGWPSTAYDPDGDPAEPWNGIYESSRSTYPSTSATRPGVPWPSGTGAKWVSITGASDEAERKLFRTSTAHPLTIATAGPIRVYIASDSQGTLYIAGDPILHVAGGEPGKEPILYEQVDLWLEAGSYACAFDTESVWDTGGDGVDPTIIAICSLDGDGDPATWLRVSNDNHWVACRRDMEPPDNEPPGPTPGGALLQLTAEAAGRGASGWAAVTYGFTAAVDSYSVAWPSVVVERLVRYGSDTYWSVFNMLGETDEVDVWMGPDLVLRAAPAQGQMVAVTLDTADIVTMSDTTSPGEGTWAAALALDGWVDGGTATPRREFGLEVGTAVTRAVADRVVATALAEAGRWDGSCRLAPDAPTPLVAFGVGDTITLDYADAPNSVRVLSVSAQAGDGGLLWDLELAAVA